VILLSLAVSPVLAEGEETTTIRVLHPVGMGFTIETDVDGSILKTWTTLNGGDVLMIKRDTTSTLASSAETYTDPSADVLEVHAGQSGPIGNKTCCTFRCSQNYYYDPYYKDCISGIQGCQACTLECSDGWNQCPGGTTELDKR
jgi:hypothetical protein